MGHYLNASADITFGSPEAVIQAAHKLQPDTEPLIATLDAAWAVIENAWQQCGEEAGVSFDTAASPEDALTAYLWSGGKWYGHDFEVFTEGLKGLATGAFDFNEDVDVIWRERLHADGTITQHKGTIIYEGDEG